MKVLVLVVAALALANSSMMTSKYDMFFPRMFRNNDDVSTTMGQSGLCKTLCKRQIMGQMNTDLMNDEDFKMIQQQLIEKMDQMMERTDMVMPVEQKRNHAMQIAEQLTQMYRQLSETRMNMHIDEVRKSGVMMVSESVPSRLRFLAKHGAEEILSEISMRVGREEPEDVEQMRDVLSATILSQMLMQDSGLVMDKDFRNEILEMILSIDMVRTQRILADISMRASQVQITIKLLEQQKRMLQMYTMMMMKTTLNTQVEIGQELLKTLEDLTVVHLSHQMVINSLQRMMMTQRELIQKLKIEKLDFQSMSMMRMSPMMMMPQMIQV
ncbi:uncharacterized protein LOC109535209 [Dendroctonus ponderosae]|uniref:Uncharacterized protein n=1 Tax=Dendroctonus ponderosae TaxID=77166 RepID=U4U7L2_DENPD|nr:uncharacterized protein LOC109535209 [Dendroctonus ponderosae]ERL89057.1 hypothetical protein D910_06435 [Dendroctonus ponderosae]